LSTTSAQSVLSHTIADEQDGDKDCIGRSVGGVDAVAAERKRQAAKDGESFPCSALCARKGSG
jgi:hypothetical protein